MNKILIYFMITISLIGIASAGFGYTKYSSSGGNSYNVTTQYMLTNGSTIAADYITPGTFTGGNFIFNSPVFFRSNVTLATADQHIVNESIRFQDLIGTTQIVLNGSVSRIGIGTSNPVLEAALNHGIDIQNNENRGSEIRFRNNVTSYGATDGYSIQIGQTAQAYVWNYENAALQFGTNNAARATITANGNVMVGTTYDYAKLGAVGSVSSLQDATANTRIGGINQNGSRTAIFSSYWGAGSYTPIWFVTSDLTRMVIETGGNISMDTNLFYLDSTNDRLGIGTTNPYQKLHVSGGNAEVWTSVNGNNILINSSFATNVTSPWSATRSTISWENSTGTGRLNVTITSGSDGYASQSMTGIKNVGRYKFSANYNSTGTGVRFRLRTGSASDYIFTNNLIGNSFYSYEFIVDQPDSQITAYLYTSGLGESGYFYNVSFIEITGSTNLSVRGVTSTDSLKVAGKARIGYGEFDVWSTASQVNNPTLYIGSYDGNNTDNTTVLIAGGKYNTASKTMLELSNMAAKDNVQYTGHRITSGVGTGPTTANDYLSIERSRWNFSSNQMLYQEIARFDSNGRFGIGDSSPDTTLDVIGNITISQGLGIRTGDSNPAAAIEIGDDGVNSPQIKLTSNENAFGLISGRTGSGAGSGNFGIYNYNISSYAIKINKTTNSLTITNLTGTGNAYACLDSNGVLYRSGVACI